MGIVQLRGRARIWSGSVNVYRSGTSCYGKRSNGYAYGQWEVGDIIIRADQGYWSKWRVEDSISLGENDDIFDDAIMRLDVNEYASVTTAIDSLKSGVLKCDEGVCIAYSSSNQEYYLLVRSD